MCVCTYVRVGGFGMQSFANLNYVKYSANILVHCKYQEYEYIMNRESPRVLVRMQLTLCCGYANNIMITALMSTVYSCILLLFLCDFKL